MNMDKRIVGIFAALITAIYLLVGCARSSTPVGQPSEKPLDESVLSTDPALAMVERFGMGSNLEQMAVQVSKATHTYGEVVEKHGTNAPTIVRQEIHKLLPDYQLRWNQNLANAYSSHLSVDELRSLAKDGKSSPYVSKLLSAQSAVATDMKSSSTAILTDLVTKALTNAIK